MSREDALARLERFMLGNVPLAEATGAHFAAYDGRTLNVNAPLAPNSNHHGTAFGGSLYVVALAAGWALVHLLITQAGLDGAIYVQHAEADYRRPVTGDLDARAQAPARDALQRFLTALELRRRARIGITATIGGEREPAFTLHARFVARLPDAS